MTEKLKEAQNQLMNETIEDAKQHGSNIELIKKQLDKSKSPGGLALDDFFKHEPIRVNRFLVEFPKEFNIESWAVESIKMPKIVNKKWENTEITLRQFISHARNETVMAIIPKKNFELKIKLLDPTGEVVAGWGIDIKKIISVDFGGTFNYMSDGIPRTNIILKTKKCTVLY